MYSWDSHSYIHFTGSVPVDMDSPPSVGDIVTLTIGAIHFEVEIHTINKDEYEGEIKVIDPPAIESNGIKRGDGVSFYEKHISVLRRIDADV